MKSHLRLFAFAGFGSVAALAVLVACSDDDTVITGNDAGVDGGGGLDDSSVTPADASVRDALPDVVTIPDFVAEIESAMCGSLARCCFGNAAITDGGVVDGGTYSGRTYNGGKCLGIVRNLGFEFSAVGSEFVDGGTVKVDPAKARECRDKLTGLTCNMTGAELATIRASCFDAFLGNRPTGAKCTQSIECPKGSLCDPDGGTCAPLRGDGGSCNVYENVGDAGDLVIDSIKNEEACSSRGSGDTKLRCTTYDLNAPDYYRPRSQWVCQPQVDLNADCNSTVWCANGICDTTGGLYQCKSPVDYFANNCTAVLNPL
jgi:hypothetical protein